MSNETIVLHNHIIEVGKSTKMVNYGDAWIEQFDKQFSRKNHYQEKVENAQAYDASPLVWKDGYLRAERLALPKDSTVLDIGCGPGVLAVPLAGRIKHITAVDPSSNMLSLLEKHIQKEHISNISIIQKCWEDIDLNEIGSHDYVIASYSLLMRELVPALVKMNNAAKKEVILYWFLGAASWEKLLIDLYPVVYGAEYEISPKCDLIYGALSQLNVSPRVEPLTGTSFRHFFADMEQAVLNIRKRLKVDIDKFDGLFERYVRENYVKRGDGWEFNDQTHYVQISWLPTSKL